MKKFDFCKQYDFIWLESGCVFTVWKNEYGGLSLMKDGGVLLDVMDFSIDPTHPFPSITVKFPLRCLHWTEDVFTSKMLSPALRQVLDELKDADKEQPELFKDRDKVVCGAEKTTGFLGFIDRVRRRFRF